MLLSAVLRLLDVLLQLWVHTLLYYIRIMRVLTLKIILSVQCSQGCFCICPYNTQALFSNLLIASNIAFGFYHFICTITSVGKGKLFFMLYSIQKNGSTLKAHSREYILKFNPSWWLPTLYSQRRHYVEKHSHENNIYAMTYFYTYMNYFFKVKWSFVLLVLLK